MMKKGVLIALILFSFLVLTSFASASLVLYYPMNGSGEEVISGQYNITAPVNPLTFDGQAMLADSGDVRGEITGAPCISTNCSESTFIIWVRPYTINTNWNTLLSNELQFQSLGLVGGYYTDEQYLIAPEDIYNDSWYQLAFSVNSSDVDFYWNGIWNATYSRTPAYYIMPVEILTIGSGNSGQYPFDGLIGEIRVYDNSLNVSEILAIYNIEKAQSESEPEPEPTIPNPFNSTWDTTLISDGSSDSYSISLPLGGTCDFIVDWGDGSSNHITACDDANATHAYDSEGIYNISIDGILEGFRFSDMGDKLKIIDISHWGIFSMGQYGTDSFWGTANLKISAIDILNLTKTEELGYMFRGSGITSVPNMNDWDVSGIKDMSGTFLDAIYFNEDISGWDTSGIGFNYYFGSFDEMFHNAKSFNQDIGNWNISGSVWIGDMFNNASSFNQDLSNWDVSHVIGMDNMFVGSNLSKENYDNLLIGWASLPSLQTGVPFGAGTTQYCLGESARNDTLIGTYGWTITDGGKNCEEEPLPEPTPQNYTIAYTMRDAGAGIGRLILYLAQALAPLLIVLAIVGIITAIMLALGSAIRNWLEK